MKKRKGEIMKANLFTSIALSILFYTTLLSTTFVMPMVLAARGDAAASSQDWERAGVTPPAPELRRDRRLPQTDAPLLDPTAKPAPIDRSGPDAAMIKPGKVRAKTIKA